MTDTKKVQTLSEAMEVLEDGEEAWIDSARLLVIDKDQASYYRAVGWEAISIWERHLDHGFAYNMFGLITLHEDDIKA